MPRSSPSCARRPRQPTASSRPSPPAGSWVARRPRWPGRCASASSTRATTRPSSPSSPPGRTAPRPTTSRVARVIRGGEPLLLDIGGRRAGYCSDTTRTFWVGGRRRRAPRTPTSWPSTSSPRRRRRRRGPRCARAWPTRPWTRSRATASPPGATGLTSSIASATASAWRCTRSRTSSAATRTSCASATPSASSRASTSRAATGCASRTSWWSRRTVGSRSTPRTGACASSPARHASRHGRQARPEGPPGRPRSRRADRVYHPPTGRRTLCGDRSR